VPLGTVRRLAVFPAGHPLASRAEISVRDLAGEPIIDAATDREYWLVDPRPGNARPVVVGPPARTVEEMLAFVSAGRGMAITSSTVAETSGSGELAFVPITDLEAATVLLATRVSDDRPEPAAVRDRLARSWNAPGRVESRGGTAGPEHGRRGAAGWPPPA
jgi:DNA-binding transcriptional LysR family regulator